MKKPALNELTLREKIAQLMIVRFSDIIMEPETNYTSIRSQEEAQRLGRILRPKERMSRFFTLISRNTVEEDFGSNRQKFLAEQGYAYRIIRYSDPEDLDVFPEMLPDCKGN